ncbi:hypothetical protein ES702_02746 [subsurface metagenome]
MRNKIIFGFVLILLSCFVSAALDDGFVYYSLNDDNISGATVFDVTGEGRNAFNNGSTTGVAGILEEGFDLDGASHAVKSYDMPRTAAGTICMWANFDTLPAAGGLYDMSTISKPNENAAYCYTSNAEIVCGLRVGAGGGSKQWEIQTTGANLVINNNYHICVVQNGISPDLYVNGTNMSVNYNDDLDRTDWTEDLQAGAIDNSHFGYFNGVYLDGMIDELVIYNNSKTPAEISKLYNNGTGFNPDDVIPQFELTLQNIFTSASITNFSAQITNSSLSINITTVNGTIEYPKGQILNITIFNVTGTEGVYFNQTRNEYDSSSNLEMNVHQAILVIDAQEKIINTTLTVFNATVIRGLSQFNESVNNITTFFVDSGEYNISGIAENISFNATTTVTALSLQNVTKTLFFGANQLNITAKQFFTNASIDNFVIGIRFNGTFIENITDTEGNVSFLAPDGIYNLTIFTDDYADTSTLVNLSNSTQNHTFFLFTRNSILFNIFDEILLTPVDNITVTVSLFSDLESINKTTDNGSVFFSLLSPSTYTIRASGINFSTRYYEFTLIADSSTSIDLYMINESDEGFKEITVSVIDENSNDVENALIKVLRYDINSNSFTVREIRRTNSEGETFVDIVKFEEFYKFEIIFDSILKLTTQDSQITKDELSPFQISFGEVIGQTFFSTVNANGTILFNNATNNVNFVFSDPSNVITQGCVELFRISSVEKTSLNVSCISGSSGSIFIPVPFINDTTYSAVGTVFVGNTERFSNMKIVSFKSEADLGKSGWLFNLFLTLMLAGFGVFNPIVMCILVPLPTLFLTIFNFINLSIEFALGFLIAGLIVAFIISRR